MRHKIINIRAPNNRTLKCDRIEERTRYFINNNVDSNTLILIMDGTNRQKMKKNTQFSQVHMEYFPGQTILY